MSDVLVQSLQITALGMGLVFGAIIVLWLMMIFLTAVSADRKERTSTLPGPAPAMETDFKAQVAAIAVAIALADQEACEAHALPTPPTAIVSAWQLGMRTRLLAQKGNFRRR